MGSVPGACAGDRLVGRMVDAGRDDACCGCVLNLPRLEDSGDASDRSAIGAVGSGERSLATDAICSFIRNSSNLEKAEYDLVSSRRGVRSTRAFLARAFLLAPLSFLFHQSRRARAGSWTRCPRCPVRGKMTLVLVLSKSYSLCRSRDTDLQRYQTYTSELLRSFPRAR